MLQLDHAQQERLRYASFVVESAQLVYVEAPKAGCTSLKHTIASLYGVDYSRTSTTLKAEKSSSLGIHDRSLLAVPSLLEFGEEGASAIVSSNDYIRFCLVRNPFLRLVSVWLDRLLCRAISPLNPLVCALGFPKYRAEIRHLQIEFAQFVDYLFKHEAPTFSNHHWSRMVDLLMPDALNYNCVIKVERPELLKSVERHVVQHGHVWPGIPKFNKSLLNIGFELYNHVSAKRVLEIYEEDFTRFSYDKFIPRMNPTSITLPDESLVNSIQERNQRVSFLSLSARGLI